MKFDSFPARSQGLINTVRGIPYNAQKRRCFIPLSYLVENKLSQQDLFNGNFGSDPCRHVVYQLCNRAFFHFEKSIQLFEKEKTPQKSLFLPLIVIHDFLTRIKKIDFDLTNKFVQERNPWLVWNLWRHKYPTSKNLSAF